MGIMTHLVSICGGSFVTEEKAAPSSRPPPRSRESPTRVFPRPAHPWCHVCDAQQAMEVEKFFQAHPVPLAGRKISQMLENTRINAKWLETMKSGKLGDDGFFVLIMMTMDMA